ncbi:MAG TPA: CDP-glucose 4,6-dehydratase [Candidatus Omnitrophica bacterium]|nr:CDP-glucose 4,6-dehydratase [Candidatus Omnitrophota bacterium]
MKNNIFKGKKILITGHTGFKGTWLSLWLNKLGADVVGYALKPPTKPNLFEICSIKDRIISVTSDVRDFNKLQTVFREHKPEVVFHMAAQSLVKYSYAKPIETFETNIMGTANVLEACRHVPSVRAIVNVTSDKCYENLELKRGYKESDRMGGNDPYSSSKGCAELISAAYTKAFFSVKDKKQRIFLASVRAGNVIGGGDWASDRLIPDCIRAFEKNKPVIIRNPFAVRPWQHVLDPLFGYLLLARNLYEDRPEFIGGWNFGPDNKNSKPVEWVVSSLVKKWGRTAFWEIEKKKTFNESHCLMLNSSKARARLGWQPQWNLETALTKTIDWYKAYYNNQNMEQFTMDQILEYEMEAYGRNVKK